MRPENFIFLILIVVNLGLIIRFNGTRYFYYFFWICLIDPIALIVGSILAGLQYRYFVVFSLLIYMHSFPLLEKKEKLFMTLILLLSLSVIKKYYIISFMDALLVYGTMTRYVIISQKKLIKSESQIQIFTLLILISLWFNAIKVFLLFEYKSGFYSNLLLINILDLFITILTIIAGPNAYMKINRSSSAVNIDNQFELTQREIEVIKLIAKGFTSKEIADKLFLSKKTIDYYRGSIKSKLNIANKSELVTFYNTNIE